MHSAFKRANNSMRSTFNKINFSIYSAIIRSDNSQAHATSNHASPPETIDVQPALIKFK